jgi:hypothetical protein
VAVINGEIIKPIKESGTHNLIYKCEAKKCNMVHTKYIPYKEIVMFITLYAALLILIKKSGILFTIYEK